MIKKNILFSFFVYSVVAYGNVKYVDVSKIPDNEKYAPYYSYVSKNVEYYEHWTAEWKFDKSKGELITKLKEAYAVFLPISQNGIEESLLTGDIAFYLYNLDVSSYGDSAIKKYSWAINKAPADYRGYWFLANHYANSTVSDKAIELFLHAEGMEPSGKPADFWEEYAFAAWLGNMPSHAIYAMDKANGILSGPGKFEMQLGSAIRKKIVYVDPDKDHTNEEMWRVGKGEGGELAFFCRQLGIKMLMDSTWGLSMVDYTQHQCALIITPPGIRSKSGRVITYSIAVLIRVVSDSDKLEDYVSTLTASSPDKKRIAFSDKYDKLIAYELKDKKMYPEMGGGHMNVIGVERTAPAYPGLLLESPVSISHSGEEDKLSYYRASDSPDRFKGRIFYAFMLDTCEDIYGESFEIFKNMFDRQIVIE